MATPNVAVRKVVRNAPISYAYRYSLLVTVGNVPLNDEVLGSNPGNVPVFRCPPRGFAIVGVELLPKADEVAQRLEGGSVAILVYVYTTIAETTRTSSCW
jgi:hypothetical protein